MAVLICVMINCTGLKGRERPLSRTRDQPSPWNELGDFMRVREPTAEELRDEGRPRALDHYQGCPEPVSTYVFRLRGSVNQIPGRVQPGRAYLVQLA